MIKKSERIKELVSTCEKACNDLSKEQYQNGSYSRYGGDHTQTVLKSVISELNLLKEEILKEEIKEEVLQELSLATTIFLGI